MQKFSVIICTYNSSRVIQRTLDSVEQQSGIGSAFALEVIVVDDCSKDNTVEIVINNGLECLSTGQNTGGPNRGRNIGMKKATGDYICLMDHDDVWEPDRLLSLLPHLDKAPVITSGYRLIDASTGKQQERTNQSDQGYLIYAENKTFINKLTRSKNGQITYLGSIVFHQSLKHIEFEEHFGIIDFDWVLRLFHGRKSVEVTKVTYTRHVDGSNLSLNKNYRIKDFYYSLMTIEQYQKQYPEAYKRSYRRIHGSRGRYHYLMGEMDQARFFFLKSGVSIKMLLYYLTSYLGSGIVKKYFNVFG